MVLPTYREIDFRIPSRLSPGKLHDDNVTVVITVSKYFRSESSLTVPKGSSERLQCRDPSTAWSIDLFPLCSLIYWTSYTESTEEEDKGTMANTTGSSLCGHSCPLVASIALMNSRDWNSAQTQAHMYCYNVKTKRCINARPLRTTPCSYLGNTEPQTP